MNLLIGKYKAYSRLNWYNAIKCASPCYYSYNKVEKWFDDNWPVHDRLIESEFDVDLSKIEKLYVLPEYTIRQAKVIDDCREKGIPVIYITRSVLMKPLRPRRRAFHETKRMDVGGEIKVLSPRALGGKARIYPSNNPMYVRGETYLDVTPTRGNKSDSHLEYDRAFEPSLEMDLYVTFRTFVEKLMKDCSILDEYAKLLMHQSVPPMRLKLIDPLALYRVSMSLKTIEAVAKGEIELLRTGEVFSVDVRSIFN